MSPASLINDDWNGAIQRLGGAEALAFGARITRAFAWGRKIADPVTLLRLVLAYCLGQWSLRSTATWAAAAGFADISNVGLLYRLRRCGDWLALLVGHVLANHAPKLGHSRLIRIIDASSVPKASREARQHNGIWRIHSAFDLPAERFGQFVLTDEHAAEQIDRIAVTKGEIRIADRVHLQPNRIANVLAQGGDVVLRAAWRNVRWQQQGGEPLDLLRVFRDNATGRIDQPVWIARKGGDPLALRLIAVRKSDTAAAESRRKPAPAKAGGPPTRAKRWLPGVTGNLGRGRLVYSCHLTAGKRLHRRRRAGTVSPALASGTRLQAIEERHWLARATRDR
jgi:hypothetical protein